MPTTDELLKRIEQLERKVEKLNTEIETIKGKNKEKDVPFKNPIIIA